MRPLNRNLMEKEQQNGPTTIYSSCEATNIVVQTSIAAQDNQQQLAGADVLQSRRNMTEQYPSVLQQQQSQESQYRPSHSNNPSMGNGQVVIGKMHTIGSVVIDDVDHKGAEGTGLNHNFERRRSDAEVSKSQVEAQSTLQYSTHGIKDGDKQLLSRSTQQVLEQTRNNLNYAAATFKSETTASILIAEQVKSSAVAQARDQSYDKSQQVMGTGSRNLYKAQTQSGSTPNQRSFLENMQFRTHEDNRSNTQKSALQAENKRQNYQLATMSSIDTSLHLQQMQTYQSLASECEETPNVSQLLAKASMEDTGQLKAMADVDLDRINRERNDKLQNILNSNIEQRETQCSEAHTTYERQCKRVDALKTHLEEVVQQLQILTSHDQAQKEQLEDKHQTLMVQNEELKAKSGAEKAQMLTYLNQAQERGLRLVKEKKEMLKVVHEQTEIQKSLKGRFDALKQRQDSLIEQEVSQLRREDQKLIDQIEVLRNAELTLDTFISEQMEQFNMLEEDLVSSSQQEQSLVIQREDIENYCDQLKEKLPAGCKWTHTLQKAYEQNQSEESLMHCIVDAQTRQLVMNLIRELHQFMLSHSSGTTDQSTIYSTTLEDLEVDAEKPQIPIDKTLSKVIQFASSQFELNLSEDQMQHKIQEIKRSVNLSKIKQQLSSIATLTRQMAKIQEAISSVQRRVQNELKPLIEAMKETNQVLHQERVKTRDTISELAAQHREVQDLIRACHETFINKAEGLHLQSQIQHLQTEIKLLGESIKNKECNVDGVNSEIQTTQREVTDMQARMQSLFETTAIQSDQIQQDILNIGDTQENDPSFDSQISQLRELKEKLRYELQSAENRLKYAQKKVQGAKESLYHAKGVLQDQTPDQKPVQRRTDRTKTSSSMLIRPDSRLQSTGSIGQYNLMTQIPQRNKSPTELKSQTLKRALMRQSASQTNFASVENPEGQNKQTMSAAIVPGLLTSIVKQIRRSTKTQNKVDLAELLRQSVQMSAQSNEIKKGEYCSVAPDLRLKHQALQQRAQTQIEPDFVVDTERLLAGRKDKTLRLAQKSVDQNLYQSSLAPQHTSNHALDNQKASFISQQPREALYQHHRTVTPSIPISQLDKSGSLANFQSAEPIFRQQEQAPQSQNFYTGASNFKTASQPMAQNHQNAGSILISSLGEEQGCQMLTNTSHQNLNVATSSVVSHLPNEQVSSSVELIGKGNNQQLNLTRSTNMDLVEVVPLTPSKQKLFAQTGENKREDSSSLVREPTQSSIQIATVNVSPLKNQSRFQQQTGGQKRNMRDHTQRNGLLSLPHAQFNLKRLSQGTSQSMNLIGHQSELFNSVVQSTKSKEQNINRSVAHFLNKPSTVAAHTISSKTKTQRRSQQRNQIAQKYSTARTKVPQAAVNSQPTGVQMQAAMLPCPGSRNFHHKKRSFEGTKMQMMLSASSRSGLLNQSNTSMALSHAKSHSQFKQLAAYPKRINMTMNKVSSRPTVSLTKGLVNINDPKEEEFFKSVRPLIQGAKFYIAMDSGTNVEQNVYLNVDLLSLHIESANMSSCAEIIQVHQLFKTELPPTTLEQIRIYQRSPADFSKVQNLYEFNLHVVEQQSNSSKISDMQGALESPSKHELNRQYRVKLQATCYEQLKEWIVGLNLLIKEKQSLSRLSSLIQLSID